MTDTIIAILAKELNQNITHVENVAKLLDEGNTVPFIARYRKEMHGTMDDQTIRTLADRLQYLRGLETRRAEVKEAIAAQEKLTDELSAAIDKAQTLAEIDDLYRPFRPKRRTRASVARERGLEPLAALLRDTIGQAMPAEEAALPFVNAVIRHGLWRKCQSPIMSSHRNDSINIFKTSDARCEYLFAVSQFIEANTQPVFIAQPFAHKLISVEERSQCRGICDKGGDCLKRFRTCAVCEPAVVFHIDVAVPAILVFSCQHIPGGHMAHLILIGDLGVHPTGFNNPIENRACHSSFERDHFDAADLPGQRDCSRRIGFHMDFQNRN